MTILVGGATPASAEVSPTRARERLLRLANDFRANHGVRLLREDPDLDDLAQRHSVKMAEARTLFHTANLGYKLRSYSVWGENLGYGPRLRQVFRLWKESASHRANLLKGRFRWVGIGVVYTRGVYWITMIFCG